jgi:hypothetical protein
MQQAGASAQEEVQIEVEEGRKQYLDLQADLPQAQEEGQRRSWPLPSPGPWPGAAGTEECAPGQPMLLSRVFKSERIVLSADSPFFCKPPTRFQVIYVPVSNSCIYKMVVVLLCQFIY